MTSMQNGLRLVGVLAFAALAGCQSSGFAQVSPDGVPITVESIDGPPARVKTALASELAAAATDRKVDLVNAGGEARYRVRGYLSTVTDPEGEPALAFVWDVFDAEKRRARRLTGSKPIKTAARSWEGLDKETLAKLASESMDEIAVFLKEAKAGTTVVAEAPSAPGDALAFAPQ